MSMFDVQAVAHSFGPVVVGVLLRSSVFIIAGGSLAFLLGSRTAEVRHFAYHSTLCCALLVPVIEYAAPPFRQSPAILKKVKLAVVSSPPSATGALKSISVKAAASANAHPFPWTLLATSLYVLVACVLLLRLVLSLIRLVRLVNRSEAIFDRNLHDMVQQIWLQSLSLYRPQIRISKDIHVPVVVGITQATILLPSTWVLWSREKVRAALIHEMAHVRRNDPATACLASFAACLFWLNPLVYWLRRRLVVLSEEACDEAVLLHFRPEEYARILIEFASEVGLRGNRLTSVSSVAGQRSLIKARLEYIFSGRRHEGYQRLRRSLVVGFLVPALYLAGAVNFTQQLNATGTEKTAGISIATQQQADQLESQLLRDPENLSIRSALMVFYANEGNDAAFTPHLLWAVHHHPEAPIAAMRCYLRADLLSLSHNQGRSYHEVVKAAWDGALNKYPGSSEVLFQAGLFFESSDPKRALGLFDRAAALAQPHSLAQDNYLSAVSVIYAAAMITDVKAIVLDARTKKSMDPNLAGTLRMEVEASGDPAVLCQVGIMLVQIGKDEQGLRLIQRAIDLDPANRKWKEALEFAKAEPIRRENVSNLMKTRGVDRSVRSERPIERH